ncbi:hypothetical protein K438DRAFT_1749799 [Mycena galopus ATCC 62051]|nr:hypothetical protein K438DRAFT_1749799 [Mycena galopus ATCC 62051]
MSESESNTSPNLRNTPNPKPHTKTYCQSGADIALRPRARRLPETWERTSPRCPRGDCGMASRTSAASTSKVDTLFDKYKTAICGHQLRYADTSCDSTAAMKTALPAAANETRPGPAYFQKGVAAAQEYHLHTHPLRNLCIDSAIAFWALPFPHRMAGDTLAHLDAAGDVDIRTGSGSGKGREVEGRWTGDQSCSRTELAVVPSVPQWLVPAQPGVAPYRPSPQSQRCPHGHGGGVRKPEHVDWWSEFLPEKGGKGVSKDTWVMRRGRTARRNGTGSCTWFFLLFLHRERADVLRVSPLYPVPPSPSLALPIHRLVPSRPPPFPVFPAFPFLIRALYLHPRSRRSRPTVFVSPPLSCETAASAIETEVRVTPGWGSMCGACRLVSMLRHDGTRATAVRTVQEIWTLRAQTGSLARSVPVVPTGEVFPAALDASRPERKLHIQPFQRQRGSTDQFCLHQWFQNVFHESSCPEPGLPMEIGPKFESRRASSRNLSDQIPVKDCTHSRPRVLLIRPGSKATEARQGSLQIFPCTVYPRHQYSAETINRFHTAADSTYKMEILTFDPHVDNFAPPAHCR